MVVDIETQLETRIEADWGLGEAPDENTEVAIKFTGDIPPDGVASNEVYIFIFPVEPGIVSQISRGYENILFEGNVVIWAFTHANLISAIDELVRIGNAYSNTTGAENLSFGRASPRGDRAEGTNFHALVPWSWMKNNQARAT